MKIGFIGIGVMGSHIVHNLLKENTVYVTTRTKNKADGVVSAGAIYIEDKKEIVETCDVIFTMLGYPSDVEDVYLELLESDIQDKIFIDLTTSKSSLAIELNEKLVNKGSCLLDAPVTGGDMGAKNATLSIMVGGDENKFLKIESVLNQIGSNIVYQGRSGNGMLVKMCNQIAVAGSMFGMVEAMILAKKKGISTDLVNKSIATGSAGSKSIELYYKRIESEDYDPGFYIKHFVKDLKIILEQAKTEGLELPFTMLAHDLYEYLEEEGYGDKGTQALILYYLER